jgi:hypothetical protein
LQRSPSDPESSADTRDQLSGPLTATLLLMPPSRPSQRGLQNNVHHVLLYRKKDQFKAYGVKKDIPWMEMVHHRDVTVELSTRLLATQREIESLHTQLRNSDATIRGYQRMVEGQASDLYPFDIDTWSATSIVQGSERSLPWMATPPLDLAVVRSQPGQ